MAPFPQKETTQENLAGVHCHPHTFDTVPHWRDSIPKTWTNFWPQKVRLHECLLEMLLHNWSHSKPLQLGSRIWEDISNLSDSIMPTALNFTSGTAQLHITNSTIPGCEKQPLPSHWLRTDQMMLSEGTGGSLAASAAQQHCVPDLRRWQARNRTIKMSHIPKPASPPTLPFLTPQAKVSLLPQTQRLNCH